MEGEKAIGGNGWETGRARAGGGGCGGERQDVGRVGGRGVGMGWATWVRGGLREKTVDVGGYGGAMRIGRRVRGWEGEGC